MKKIALFIKRYLFILVLCLSQGLLARTFVHPGGIHSMDDLNRMKAKVAAKEHPWIDAWNLLITDPQAQSTWTASPYTNIGGNIIRQAAARDARAAYLNILRWYITGSVANADCAVRICNAWSASINQVANGELYQLPISTFMQAAELLRMYPGWAKADQENFKNMALTYFYQPCHDFLSFCDAHSSWSAPALYSIMGIAVFCDDSTTYDEAANYFKTGAYSGCIMKGIMQPSGQLGEMARDQPHAAIGPAAWSHICQVAWNQGDTSLFSYGNNRLLAGYEYFCKANLNHPVEWIPYTDCSYRWYYMSLSGLCNLNKATPEFELIYNHYAVLKGIPAPYTHKMANLTRISQGDYFGYGTLTFTLDGADSPYPPYPIPAAPANLTATPGASRIYLHWTPPDGDVATGYNVWRSASADGPFTNLATLSDYTGGNYADKTAAPGTTYYYAVSAINQSGAGAKSSVAGAQSIAASATLPIGWARNDIGSYTVAGTASYANV
ncbi:MAG: alginate lyase family protein, partial [Bacteroidota bacterium]|nr:alginate lyase family protein [Bacteroidota bacterium]